MFLQAQEPGASDLAWGLGVPQSCGYRVNQDSAHGLQLTVPYDGCRIVALVMLKVPQTWRQCDWPFTGIYRPITLYLVVDYVPIIVFLLLQSRVFFKVSDQRIN